MAQSLLWAASSDDLTILPVEKLLLIPESNPSWCNLWTFLLVLLLIILENRLIPTWLQAFLQGVVEKISPVPSFLQTKQSQLHQHLLIRLLQTFHWPCCLSLDTLQILDVFHVVRGSKLICVPILKSTYSHQNYRSITALKNATAHGGPICEVF